MSNTFMNEHSEENAPPNVLLKQAESLKPGSASFSEALSLAQEKIAELALGAGLSVDDLLKGAELSPSFQDIHMEARALASQISFYKSQIK